MGFLFAGNALLALLSASFWGVADFSGGMSAKHAGASTGGALRVVRMSHLTSVGVLITLALLLHEPFPRGFALASGLVAGILSGLSLSAFYAALARGTMGASAALSGLLAAAIPSLLAVVTEGPPGWHRGAGFLIAGLAIWLIAAGPAAHEDRSTFLLATGAGIGFGFYFVAMRYAGTAGVVWPLALCRISSITTCTLILLVLGRSAGSALKITRLLILWVLATAFCDTSGNLLFVAATRAGRLDVASVLASLYPASTILMAALLLKERPTRRQALGMVIAAAAVVLITL